ncbi:hypothetical protein LAUMK35_05717 [Mycobacterium pseudokansasii]|nr:hypothetical protein LAUMK35_05717 [Mycobacterium pseudokansasii]VBA35814.1 hypothetical protein LAUMK21_05690 [Mycobacterium pseudokansasii]
MTGSVRVGATRRVTPARGSACLDAWRKPSHNQSTPPRRARPWFVATAVLCGIATVLFGFYQWQHRAWEAEVIRHNCRTPLPPLPATEVLGWPLAALIGAALITVLVGLAAVLIGRHRWWTKAAAAALLAADLLFCLLIVLVVVLVTADPDHGSVQTPESYLCPWLNG